MSPEALSERLQEINLLMILCQDNPNQQQNQGPFDEPYLRSLFK